MSLADYKPYQVEDIQLPVKCLYYRYINGFAVPCGKCEFCRRSRAREWSFRLEQESFDKYVYNCLLTYEDSHLPYHKGKPCVCKVHIQEFLKRFRFHLKKVFGATFKYFLCGEYGGKNHRPHYHMIIFTEVSLNDHSSDPYKRVNEILVNSWRHGLADIEPITTVGGSVNYLTNYMTTYYDGIEYDQYNKPFLMMSRSGLGKSWIDRHPNQVNKMVKDMDYTTVHNGYKQPLPRYLRRKIMPDEQQVARADEFYYYTQDFKLNIENKGHIYGSYRSNKIKQQREFQKQRERDVYRKAKVHANNSNSSQLSRRASTAKECSSAS